jgi:hypothetical protein
MWDALQDLEEDAHARAHARAHAHTHSLPEDDMMLPQNQKPTQNISEEAEEAEKLKQTKFDKEEVEEEKDLEHDRPSFSASAFVQIPEDDLESWFDCMYASSCALLVCVRVSQVCHSVWCVCTCTCVCLSVCVCVCMCVCLCVYEHTYITCRC